MLQSRLQIQFRVDRENAKSHSGQPGTGCPSPRGRSSYACGRRPPRTVCPEAGATRSLVPKAPSGSRCGPPVLNQSQQALDLSPACCAWPTAEIGLGQPRFTPIPRLSVYPRSGTVPTLRLQMDPGAHGQSAPPDCHRPVANPAADNLPPPCGSDPVEDRLAAQSHRHRTRVHERHPTITAVRLSSKKVRSQASQGIVAGFGCQGTWIAEPGIDGWI